VSEPSRHPPDPPPLAPSAAGDLRFDAVSGFLVFLIAMPLCLAIARASGFPPIAGIWTAVIGGVVGTLISNSQLTIKGPAAGLIVIVSGAVTELGAEFGGGMSETDRAFLGYRLALGIGVTAGVVQILFGLVRAGRLVDFLPLTPVHGMLAGVGIIIVARQIYEVFGAPPTSGAGPVALLAEFPAKLAELNPEIAAIGVAGLLILFGLPLVAARASLLKRIPAQLVVLLVAVGLGVAFDLQHQHTYRFPGRLFGTDRPAEYEVGPRFLVDMPEVLRNPAAAVVYPDFRGLATGLGLKYLLLFTLVGSLESLLSAKAVELIDPWHRKTNLDRDLLAVGAANTLSAAVGGLPMISEVVRSKANIDNGARTRLANLFHGLFLLGFVLAFPHLIHRIPLAALGAMLVYTGLRLADPRAFVRTYQAGGGRFVVFVGTVAATLATDLLIGMAVGVGLKVLFQLWNGAPLWGLWRADVEVRAGGRRVVLVVKRAAVFSNWRGLRRAILAGAGGRDEVVVDLSATRLVDHSVMEKLHELEQEFVAAGKKLTVIVPRPDVQSSPRPPAVRAATGEPPPREPAGV
jgi:MFS superfamily sulfate permease-like transporter